ncbi:LuxR family transcriptional regulator [Catenuloplanes atrovinosus]|uniref:DNA-binding CsgD family transcriptional regulator n=1 Tax=Catenuloplanes atrovinosus TaxID=137266 RepID=A0AAE3YTZ3_9ACTN|nr:LuxR family transcriptional regulator [Catenuloplanes atrovinosus]MDR7278349.1 DNA-binding CsgD family transcriptional regulator [Catenuloplanes atrovinosus]
MRISGLLIGRSEELRSVGELITGARAGRGGTLVLRGEAGIGKTALLDRAEEIADGFGVLRASGSEFEQELPFAALHQLCRPILGHLGELPARHREALEVAFGLVAGQPDALRVGLAILDLVTAAARERPLLCRVDDAQWLDAASSRAMLFLARRLGADPVVVLFAARPSAAPGELDELPELTVGGLSDEHARGLLAERSPFPLDERVRDRLVAEARGNPLALLHLPRAGGFAPPGAASAPSRVEREFAARLTGLSADARMLLVLAGADPTGDPALLWAAAGALGLDVSAAAPDAAGTGLAEFGARVRFCHPLARSAVYRAADPETLHAAHGALAEVTDPVTAPDRRAWHRALAGGAPDDDVAAELERGAVRARARGGVAAAAAFLERAAALSLDPGRRIERTLDAARAHLDAGGLRTAAELLTSVDPAVLDETQRARVEMLHGRLAFTRPGDDSGPALMVRAARRLSARDPDAARECFLDAVEMGLLVGRAGGVVEEIMATVRTEAPPPSTPDVLDALILLAAKGHRAAAPVLHDVLHDAGRPLWTHRPALAIMIASELFDLDTLDTIAAWLVRAGRESGSPSMLRLGLAQRAHNATLTGDIGQALAAAAEEEAIPDAGGSPVLYHRLLLAAHRGRAGEVSALAGAAAEGSAYVTNLHWATALLHNGLGDHPAALAAARRATAPGALFLTGAVLPELVEAAVRGDEPGLAAQALDALAEHTRAAGGGPVAGVVAYVRGLVTGEEEHFREAVERLAESPLVPYRGRAHLLYGEWLREAGRRGDAVAQLRAAHETLAAAGADAFAARAAAQLRAAGERVADRPSAPAHETLTMQEIAVARLVSAGATSKEVAGQLFISKRTVDAHLRNIFRKLGITSRAQLAGRL